MEYTEGTYTLPFLRRLGLSTIIGTFCLVVLSASPTLAFCQKKINTIMEYKVISAAENTWGYDIMMDGKLFIHQSFAPGMPGNRGFSTKEKAASAAKLVIEKINKGIMPPSLTVAEVLKIENTK